MPDFAHLPPKERAKRYRELAKTARQERKAAPDDVKGAYLIIAEQYERLAGKAEAEVLREGH
jgi:hypothetical protein